MIREYNGGSSWIRTRELKWDQIYSLAVLTTHPKTHIKRLTQVMTIIEMLQATPHVLYTLMVYGIFNLHHLIFYLQRDIIGSPCWWAKRESNPHSLFNRRILSPVRLPVPPFAHKWYIKYLIYTPPLFLSVMVHLVHKEGVEPSNTGF